MHERYEILHNLYPDYLIYFVNNNYENHNYKIIKKQKNKYDHFKFKYITINDTKLIIDYIDTIKDTNYIILDGLEIIEKHDYDNNQYSINLARAKLIKLLQDYKETCYTISDKELEDISS